MKALSVRNPWAALIASGEKTIELRTWRTSFRGEFVLVSSACKPEKKDVSHTQAHTLEMPRGVTMAVCELVDVREAEPRDAKASCANPRDVHFAWVVRVVRLLEHVPVKGSLGFWKIDESNIREAT